MGVIPLSALLMAGCGGGSPTPTPAPAAPPPVARTSPPPVLPDLGDGVRVELDGEGERGAYVLRPRGAPRRPTVVFLHGWTAADPRIYGPWLRHLVRRGSVVVYPVYQALPFLSPQTALANVVAGLRSALADGDVPTEGLVVAGHSAGGAMSADLAATAQRLDLPAPRAVFAAYPGRRIRRIPLALPSVPLDGVPERTRVVALYGTDDQTVGAAEARRIARAPGRTSLVRVDDPAVDDHLGPQRAGPATRRTFWARLDRLLR